MKKTYIYDTTEKGIKFMCIAKAEHDDALIEVRKEIIESSLHDACWAFEEMLNSEYEMRRWQITIESIDESISSKEESCIAAA